MPPYLQVLLTVICLSLMQIAIADYHGDAYQELPASQKFSDLTNKILQDQTTDGYYSTLEAAELFLESMATSFNTVADDMPKQFWGTRKKLVHTVGIVGAVTWTPISNHLNYSGIFASGSQNAILRFSSGPQPNTEGNSSGLTPGLALKFLRDGVPSANLFCLASTSALSSFNFFAHDFTNHVPDLPYNTPIAAQLVREKFATASNFPLSLGLSPLAEFDSSGKKASSVNFPWRVILHPTTQLHKAFPETNPGIPFYQQLVKVIKPGPLFSVYAIDDPSEDSNVKSAVLIAQITLKTPLSLSKFGDKTLFYQHSSLESDFVYKPTWQSIAKKIQESQRSSTTQVSYPDLPWN